MARPGPAPKPLQLRMIEGTDRKGRQGRSPIDLSTVPDPPKDVPEPTHELSSEVRRHWDKLCRDLEAMDMLTSADAAAMTAYCEAVELHSRASRTVGKSPLLVQNSHGNLVVNRTITVQQEAARTLLRFAQEFGLTPAARTQVEVAKRASEGAQPASENPFEAATG